MVGGLRVLFLVGLDVAVFALRKGRTVQEMPATENASMQQVFVEEEEGDELVTLSQTCLEATSTEALIQCAEETVDMYASDMISNLQSHGIDKLDLGWPGTGFNQAAYGGQWQVLTSLERRAAFRVENLVGASGGASSTVLALADVDRSARTMLDTLLDRTWGSVTTSKEYTKYKSVMQEGNWSAVKSYGYASVVCRSNLVIMQLVHDFKDQDQAAKAFAASGDVISIFTGFGYSLGRGVWGCHDGGDLMGMGGTPLLYYNTNYGYATGCDQACVVDLFKKGVEATIRTLLSSSLQAQPHGDLGVPGGSVGGSIAIQKPKDGNWKLSQYRGSVRSGGFWEILAGPGLSSERRFVQGSSLS